MPVLAGQRIADRRGAICTQSTLAVFAQADRRLIRVIKTNHFPLSDLIIFNTI